MHFAVGDIVQRTDTWSTTGRKSPNRTRYVITHIATDGSGWIYARKLGGSGGTITFPSQFMIKKVG